MPNHISVIVDGCWQDVQIHTREEVRQEVRRDMSDSSRVIDLPTNEFDRIVVMIGQVVKTAQSLPEKDQRRVRDLVATAHNVLCATTSLPKDDQRLFELALREAARNA